MYIPPSGLAAGSRVRVSTFRPFGGFRNVLNIQMRASYIEVPTKEFNPWFGTSLCYTYCYPMKGTV